VEELEANVERWHPKGVKLYTAEWKGDSRGWKLTDPEAYRYLAKSEELGIKNIHVHKGPTIWPLDKDGFGLGLPGGDDDPLLMDTLTGSSLEIDAVRAHLGWARLRSVWRRTPGCAVTCCMTAIRVSALGRRRSRCEPSVCMDITRTQWSRRCQSQRSLARST
jgi:hypothetical protein